VAKLYGIIEIYSFQNIGSHRTDQNETNEKLNV